MKELVALLGKIPGLDWVAILKTVLQLLLSISDVIREKQLLSAGESVAVAKSLALMQKRLELGEAVEAEIRALNAQEVRDKLKGDAR